MVVRVSASRSPSVRPRQRFADRGERREAGRSVERARPASRTATARRSTARRAPSPGESSQLLMATSLRTSRQTADRCKAIRPKLSSQPSKASQARKAYITSGRRLETGRNDGVAEAERVGRDLRRDRDDEGDSERQPQCGENSRCRGRKRDLHDLPWRGRVRACARLRQA